MVVNWAPLKVFSFYHLFEGRVQRWGNTQIPWDRRVSVQTLPFVDCLGPCVPIHSLHFTGLHRFYGRPEALSLTSGCLRLADLALV